MCADNNVCQRTVVLVLAVMLALCHSAFDTLIRVTTTTHIIVLRIIEMVLYDLVFVRSTVAVQ